MDHALQTVVISLPGLRRLRFPIGNKGREPAIDLAARTVLAALGLCAATLSIEAGCDLRSRCLLVPELGLSGWESVRGDGKSEPFAFDADAACRLLNEAIAAADLPWMVEPLALKPCADLIKLVKESRKLAMQSGAETAEG
jgi:CRISPR-associated protein Csb1